MREPAIAAKSGQFPDATGRTTGTITLVTGCMFSGKTTELLRLIESYPAHHVVAIKHAIDRRFADGAIVSHGGRSYPAIPLASCDGIVSLLTGETRIVAIDEAHFFGNDLLEPLKAVSHAGFDAVLAALDRSSWGEPFAIIELLRRLGVQEHHKLAVCARCGRPADRTQRLTPIVAGNLVGGAESYEPRCAACWYPPPEPPPVTERA